MAPLIEDWKAHCEQIGGTADAIFATADVKITEKGFADPTYLSLTLLARTVSNLKAALTLLHASRIVEARTITRCVLENLYWTVGLVEDGDTFVKQMRDDELSHRRSMGQAIFSGEHQLDGKVEERLRTQMRDLNRNGPVTKVLNPKAVAGIRGDFKRSYIFYAQLSSDSAHPSVTALNRYVVADLQGPGFDTNPIVRPNEVAETLEYLSMSALGVCVGVNQILGGTPGGEQLQARAARHDELSNRTRDGSERDD
ncbi:hypothetical protein FBZ93_12116 [Bradyrhizobium macuxiense]|uniref:Uncharacterized protein n=2 Tax=Bradyrhizobium macuxiense TaxID=1755647 RepID=A0A560KW68_9BRAD|nr:hypothetical protein FBZ93_12116 [Bradyrhizobium macuxiense]